MRTRLSCVLIAAALAACSDAELGAFATSESASGGAGGAGGEGAGTTTGAGGEGVIAVATSAGSGGAPPLCTESVTLRVRDSSAEHPNIQWSGHPSFSAMVGVREGILGDELAEEPGGGHKPVYIASSDVSPDGPTFAPFTGASDFDTWYRDVPGTNFATDVVVQLTPEGESLVYDDADFHPIGSDFGFGDEGFALNDTPNNWHFTTEAVLFFRYQGGEIFLFRGDDDMWVYVNQRLAMDLGGIHGPEEGSIDLDAQAAKLGLSLGAIYELHIFHAERNYSGSNFRLEITDFCLVPEPPQ